MIWKKNIDSKQTFYAASLSDTSIILENDA